ncbi:uncharacterized protein SPAPADRAFT_57897 [Spathaspora passalidarum NRRL Y-27907]|uniref:Small EDRK-rich factor-like N-terminal domain-containing protein n=1 Tax=Spathaspora passalidarum (strain NRRL Y-27907 / 11-Y1) TaxID=619300 RepID=G3AF11_SPAPN|nr:uncharacterized protein SPAPADRAFT_57897 [Spathaspora passalidarum NRRL Y-27907]EGW34815.1 hypothetical protein SPAPADRAFT_57897 [Spathaspora passalidarum NRRL Y-27907]
MARGNQRELARAKNLKKQQDAAKGQKQGDKAKRMESDAEKMRLKQAAGGRTISQDEEVILSQTNSSYTSLIGNRLVCRFVELFIYMVCL